MTLEARKIGETTQSSPILVVSDKLRLLGKETKITPSSI